MQKVLRSNCLKSYFERRMSKINTIETKPKESQFSQFGEKIYIYNQFFLNDLVLWFCF